MKKILRFKKELSFLMLLILLCGLITPVSEIKAEEKVYYIERRGWADSRIIIGDRENTDRNIKYGVMDYNGKVIVEPKYDEIRLFSEGLAVAIKDGKRGCIDKEGREVIPFKFDLLQNFDNGLAVASKDGKWGCIDKEGREVIPFKFKHLDRLENGFLMVVRSDGRYGYINKRGEEFYIKNSEKYDELEKISDNLYRVKKGEKVGIINKKGKVVVPIKYNDVGDFHEGMAKVTQKEEENHETWYSYGFVNKKGKEVISADYNSAEDFHEGLAAVSYGVGHGAAWGFVNKKGKEVIPVKYDGVNDFHEGLAAVIKYGELGFVNKKGKVVIPFKYEEVAGLSEGLSEGLAAVEKDEKWGFVNKKGKIVIPFKYRGAENFSKGKAEVGVTEYVGQRRYYVKQVINKKGAFLYYIPGAYKGENESYMLINKEGKKIVLTDYFIIDDYYEGRAYAIHKSGGRGYIDENGNPITDFEYDSVHGREFKNGIAMVCKDGKYGFINREGKVIVPIIHGYNGA
ncbi:MAG: WG repeat-containing protein [Catonella sp.]